MTEKVGKWRELREAAQSLRQLISDVELMLSKNGEMTDEFKRTMHSDVVRAKLALEKTEAALAKQTPAPPSPELLQLLKDSCDRDWKDESPEVIIRIACNALYWRDYEIAKLREESDNYQRGYDDAARIYENRAQQTPHAAGQDAANEKASIEDMFSYLVDSNAEIVSTLKIFIDKLAEARASQTSTATGAAREGASE